MPFVLKSYCYEWLAQKRISKLVLFPIGQALEVRDQVALVVLDFNRVGADFEVLGQFTRLGPEGARSRPAFMKVMLALTATATVPCELDAAAKAKSASVKYRAALHGADAVEMVRMQRHAGRGAAGRNGEQFNVAVSGKLVVAKRAV